MSTDAAPRRSPFVPMLLAWLVPGAGHAAIGRPWPALFVAASIWLLFAGGMALSGFENVAWDRHPWLFALQVLAGLPTGVAALLTRSTVLTEFHRHHTVGDLYTMVAGLLNVVAIADVHARCTEGDPEGRAARRAAEAPDLGALVAAGPPAQDAPPAGGGEPRTDA